MENDIATKAAENIAVYDAKDLQCLERPAEDIDAVYVFCKTSDKWTTADVQHLLTIGDKCRLVPCDTQEERLIRFGGLLESCETCLIGTEGLKAPSYYEGKIRKVPAAKAQGKRQVKTKASGKSASPETVEKSAVADAQAPREEKPSLTKPVQKPGIISPVKSAQAPAAATTTQPQKQPSKKRQGSIRPDSLGRNDDGADIEDANVTIQLDDKDCQELYDMIHVQSKDVGYTWGTDMLMGMILSLAAEAETDDDFLQSVATSIRNSDVIVERCTPVAGKIREIARRN